MINDNLDMAAELWFKWDKRRLKASNDDQVYQEDYDLIAAVTAVYRKQLERMISQGVKEQIELDAASERLAEEIAQLLGTK